MAGLEPAGAVALRRCVLCYTSVQEVWRKLGGIMQVGNAAHFEYLRENFMLFLKAGLLVLLWLIGVQMSADPDSSRFGARPALR